MRLFGNLYFQIIENFIIKSLKLLKAILKAFRKSINLILKAIYLSLNTWDTASVKLVNVGTLINY